MASTTLQERLVDLVRRGQAEEQAFLAGLPESERMRVGAFDHWSAKDHIAHLTAWRKRLVHILRTAARDETPPVYHDLDHLNAESYEQDRYLTWPDVLAEADEVTDEVAAIVSELPEDLLADPNRFAGREGVPLWRTVLGNTYWHVMTHLASYSAQEKDLQRAGQLGERMAQATIEFDPSEESRSIALYNLACLYAQIGQPERAIPLLRESFSMNSSLMPFSKEDPDLISLKERPEYQALYGESA